MALVLKEKLASAVPTPDPGRGAIFLDASADPSTGRVKHDDGTVTDLAVLDPTTLRLDQFAAPTGPLALGGQRITGLADPTGPQDAATKAYADLVGAGSTGPAGGALAGNYPSPDLAASVAGAGLALASNVLSVGAGTGITASADSVAVDPSALRLDQFAAPTASVALGGQRITGLADPTAATDALNRQGADARYPPLYDVTRYGADPTGAADSTAAVLATLALAKAAGGGLVYFPAGTYKFSDTLTVALGVALEGDDPSNTVLTWPSGLGTNGYGITYENPDDAAYTPSSLRRITNIRLEGPGASTTARGIRWPSRHLLENVWMRFWKRPLDINGNHQTARRCTFTGCYYCGPYQLASPDGGTFGDQHFHTCSFTSTGSPKKASVGIEDGASLLTATFMDCHFGESPFGIFAEGAGDGSDAMSGCDFYNPNFEGVGNAAIELQGRSMRNCRFYGGRIRREHGERDSTSYGSRAFVGTGGGVAGASIHAAGIRNCVFDNVTYDSFNGGGSDSSWRNDLGVIECDLISQTTFLDCADLIESWVWPLDWPLVYRLGCIVVDTYARGANKEYRVCRAHDGAGISRNRAVSLEKWDDTTDHPLVMAADETSWPRVIGVATHTAASTQALLVQTKGVQDCQTAGAAGDIQPGDEVGPSTSIYPGGSGKKGLIRKADSASPSVVGFAVRASVGSGPPACRIFIAPQQRLPVGASLNETTGAPQWPGLVWSPHAGLRPETAVIPGNLVSRWARLICPRTGTLHDLSYWVAASSGNVILMIFDVGEADATKYTKLWDSGSLAVGALNTWQSADPALAVVQDQQIMAALVFDNGTAAYGRSNVPLLANNAAQLPASFLPDSGASFRKMAGAVTLGSFAAPASQLNSGLTNNASPPVMIARVA